MRLTTAVALLFAATPATAQHPDLSGQWAFNAAQSDNPRDMLQGGDTAGGESHGGGAGGRYPGMGGGRGGFGGRGGYGRGRGGERGGGGMSEEQRQRMHQTMQLAFQAPAALTVAETDSSVAFALDGDESLLLFSDGRKVTQKVEGGGDVEIEGRWQGNDFVVERTVSGGGRSPRTTCAPRTASSCS